MATASGSGVTRQGPRAGPPVPEPPVPLGPLTPYGPPGPPGPPGPFDVPQTSEEMLWHACALLRLCGCDAVLAAVLLALMATGTVVRLAYAGLQGPLVMLPLAAVVAASVISAGLAARCRWTLVSVLGSVRAATGAPLGPAVPWTPVGLHAALDPEVRDGELRRLLGAAYRCCESAWHAVLWASAAGVLFVLWSAVSAAAAGG